MRIDELLAFFINVFRPLLSGIKSGVEWFIYREPTTNEENKKMRIARAGCIIGGFCFVLLVILVFIAIFNRDVLFPSHAEDAIETDGTQSGEPIDSLPEDEEEWMTLPGGRYAGEIDTETRKPDGWGKMKYDNGDFYEGTWSGGVIEGEGVMRYSNGDSYNGAWKNGQKEGEGVYLWKDGRKYDGHFKDGKRDGQGTYSGWTGYVAEYNYTGTYIGESKEDRFEGAGRFEFDNGDVFVGIFSRDRMWNGTYRTQNGTEWKVSDGVFE